MGSSITGSSWGGGMNMGRDRYHDNQNYTYLGEDNQTHPLEDLAARFMDQFNQNNAQQNLLFGGAGYGNTFRPRGAGAPPPPAPYGGNTYAGSPSAASSGFGAAALPSGPKAAQGGGGMANARMAGGGGQNPFNPQISANPALGIDHGGDYAGDAPGYGDTTGDWYNEGLGDQGGQNGGPNGINYGQHFNYLPGVDPNDGYFPRDPSILNDGDNARPSPVKPVGASNDPLGAQFQSGMQEPTGGLYGEFADWAAGNPTQYENAVGSGYNSLFGSYGSLGDKWGQLFGSPTNSYDDQAAQGYNFLRGGGLTDLEGQTRGGLSAAASGQMPAEAWQTRQGYVDQTSGPNANENQTRNLILSFINGDGGPGSLSNLSGGGGGSFSSQGGGLGAGYTGSLAAYQDMVNGGGYSPAEKAALVNEGMGSARTALDSAQAEMMRRQGINGNSAGLYGAIANLAGQRASTLGSQARQNTLAIANEAERRKEAGAAGLGNLAGIEASNAASQASLAASQNAQSAENARVAAQLKLAAMGQLGGWDENARKNTLAGLAGMNKWDENRTANQQFGLQGLAAGDALRRQGMLAGSQGLANMGDSRFGRQATALGGYGNALAGQGSALNGANAWANQQRQNRQFGIQGQAGLYNSQQQQQNSYANLIAQILGTPRAKHNDGTDTSGNGGFQI